MRIRLTALVVLLLAFNIPIPAATRALFDNPDVLRAGVEASSVQTGDFNNDGKADVAATAFTLDEGFQLLVFPGRGDGTFDLARATPLARFSRWQAAHLNGDAYLDAVFVYQADYSVSRVEILLGTGDGTFTPGVSVTISPCFSPSLAAADVTLDGHIDVLTCGLTVLRNNGDATFQAPIHNNIRVDAVLTGDANGDAIPDAFLDNSGNASVALSKGDGTFFPTVWLEKSAVAAEVGDLDGNGRTDFVYRDAANADVGVQFATLNGNYPSSQSVGFMTVSSNQVLHVADLNGDGKDDILGGSEGHIFTWITKPDGSPGEGRHWVAPFVFRDLATADFDQDGNLDVVAGGDGVAIIMGEAGGSLHATPTHMVARATEAASYAKRAMPLGGLVDVTSDGNLDAVTLAGMLNARITVLPGLGNGTFGAPIETALPAESLSYDYPTVFFADFDEDGIADIFHGSPGGYALHLANGDGTFREAWNQPYPIQFDSGVTGDFDGDGHQDVIMSRDLQNLHWFPGNGDGTFDAAIVTGEPGWGSSAGDVNNDGIDDLVLGESLLLGSSTRQFTRISYAATNSDEIPSGLVDLDADGNLDIIKKTYAGLLIRLGNGDGTFANERSLMTSASGNAVPGDFNGDGNTDVAFGTTVLLGDGQGWFNGYARARYPAGAAPSATGDTDGNGSSDLLIVNPVTRTIEVIRTLLSDSRELPLTVAFDSPPTTFPAGVSPSISVKATGLGSASPTGAVVLSTGGRVGALVELVGDVASTTFLCETLGPASLAARFTGDDVYAAAVESLVPVEVTKALVWSYPVTDPYGPAWNDVVHVSGDIGSSLSTRPTGVVTILVDGTVRATGTAPHYDLAIGSLPLGLRNITLQYAGDALHLPYEKSWWVQVYKAVPQQTFTITPPGSANAGEPVTLTMTFADTSITGVVRFSATGMVLGNVPIVNGVASITTSTLRVGAIAAWGTFQGNALYAQTVGSLDYTITDVPLPPSASTFSVLTPCRIIDTRKADAPLGGPALPAAGTRSIQITGTCGVPAGAKAVAVNLTVVAPTQVGFLTLFPGASPRSGTSTINYRTGKTRANNAIVPLSAGGILNVYNSGPNAEHFLIDVNGYYK